MTMQILPSMIPSTSSMAVPVPFGSSSSTSSSTSSTSSSTSSNVFGAVVDSSEIEIEKILNEIGFFSDDYVMVHDKTTTGSLNVVGATRSSSTPEPTIIKQEPAYCVSPEITRPVVEICPKKKYDDIQTFLNLEPAPAVGKTTAAGRKRKCPSVSRKLSGKPQITEVERRERNRQHAKKSRLRKKSLTSVLEENAKDLKAENERLREELSKIIGKQKLEDAIESHLQSANESFIESLKANRVLDDKSKGKLKTLSKKVASKSLDSLLSQSDDDSN